MNDLMIDLETMGSVSYSAIVSIGAVEFDLETGQTGRTFYRTISLDSCLKEGFVVSASTVLFWMKQNGEARKTLYEELGQISIREALEEFATFCKGDYTLWGNSARFDLGILQNAYNKLDIVIPWNFRNERCVRTLVSFDPETKKNWKRTGVDHNALHDCYNQVGYCSEIWRKLKQWN